MISKRVSFIVSSGLLGVFVLGCANLNKNNTNTAKNSPANTVSNTVSNVKPPKKTDNEDNGGEISNDSEKAKPEAGKGNIQGTVLYNSKPAEGIEVELCEKFNRFMGDCNGKTYKAKTDKDGIYVIANAEPKEYEVLKAQVFKTNYFVFSQSGIMQAKKYTVETDKTTFATDINLFKNDLKTTNPKAGGKAEANDLELKWDAYPDASYYKVSLYSEDPSVVSTVIGERVEDTGFKPDKTLTNGKYRFKVEAYNSNDRKLAENSDDIKFTVTGGEEPKK